MAEIRRIMISIPNNLLQEVDGIIANDKLSRSQFVREAMRLYIEERRRRTVRDMMRRGYQEMAIINLTLAEEGLLVDVDSESFSILQEASAEGE